MDIRVTDGLGEDVSALQGARILLVEDEALVAMLLEDMLADNGCEVVATAPRLAEALAHAKDADLKFDLAILDLNLAGENTFSVAQALKDRGTPFVFATGYGAGGLPPEWRDRPTLQKPFTSTDITQVLHETLGKR
jgi:CheY-like chemotaxis protein